MIFTRSMPFTQWATALADDQILTAALDTKQDPMAQGSVQPQLPAIRGMPECPGSGRDNSWASKDTERN
jgi:hypothetical protein